MLQEGFGSDEYDDQIQDQFAQKAARTIMIKSILHGSWTGAVAGFVASYLLGVLFFTFGGVPDYEPSEFIPVALVIDLTSLWIGVPIGLVAGVIGGSLLNSVIHPPDAVRFGIKSGVAIAICVLGIIYLGRLPDSGADTASVLGLISCGALAGALGGYLFGRLFARYVQNRPNLSA